MCVCVCVCMCVCVCVCVYVCVCEEQYAHTHTQCMVPWETTTTDGAMLIMLHFEEHNATAGCDKECIDTMGMFVLLTRS